jgi:16S rRNA (cytosine1402-N4)-methyltransferase
MTDRPSEHVPVLLNEIVRWLAPSPGKVLVDGTLGGGGHTRALAELVSPGGRVVALDRDPAAVSAARTQLAHLPVLALWCSFARLDDALEKAELAAVDGLLLDLGWSSDQLADGSRGFSFRAAGELDLRFDPTEGEPAWRLLERMRENDLANLIYEFGEERHSRRIARAIVARRDNRPVRTAADLADLVRGAVPRSRDRLDPATRTFQALRIAVNDELGALDRVLSIAPRHLRLGGRLAVISFHSLEDRRVKNAFRDDPRWHSLTKKPLRPTDEEAASNPRAASAKLRVAERTLAP